MPTLTLPFESWSTVAISAARTPGRAVRRVGDAHADPHFGRLRREPRDQRPALEPLATRRHRQGLRELLHHAERVLELRAVGGFRNDDPVERPDRVEVELFGEAGEILELLDGHLVAEVRQVQRELHETASSSFVDWSRRRAPGTSGMRPSPLDLPARANLTGRRQRSDGPRSVLHRRTITAKRHPLMSTATGPAR